MFFAWTYNRRNAWQTNLGLSKVTIEGEGAKGSNKCLTHICYSIKASNGCIKQETTIAKLVTCWRVFQDSWWLFPNVLPEIYRVHQSLICPSLCPSVNGYYEKATAGLNNRRVKTTKFCPPQITRCYWINVYTVTASILIWTLTNITKSIIYDILISFNPQKVSIQ